MDRGDLVSNDIVNGIVSERLDAEDCKPGFILDGFPRTIGQAEALDGMLADKGIKLDAVIEMTADADVLVSRVINRAKESNRPGRQSGRDPQAPRRLQERHRTAGGLLPRAWPGEDRRRHGAGRTGDCGYQGCDHALKIWA